MEITAEIYDQISRAVRAAARRMGRVTIEDAEDLTQSVVLKLWTCREEIRSPKAFASRIATTTWLNMCRSRSNYAACLARYRDSLTRGHDTLSEQPNWEGPLGQYLAALDPRTVDAIDRRFWRDESYAEIGRALGISNCAAHKLVRRGVRHLKHALTNTDLTDGHRCPSMHWRPRKRERRIFRSEELATANESAIQAASTAMRVVHPRTKRGQACAT